MMISNVAVIDLLPGDLIKGKENDQTLYYIISNTKLPTDRFSVISNEVSFFILNNNKVEFDQQDWYSYYEFELVQRNT